MSLSFKQLGVYVGLLALGTGAGIFGSRYLIEQEQAIDSPVSAFPASIQPQSQTRRSLPPVADNLNFIAQAVQKIGPAVVRIDAARQNDVVEIPEAFKQPFFRRFFGNELPPPRERIERGTGSGFIVSSDGRLLTNAHVIEGSDTVQVTLKDESDLFMMVDKYLAAIVNEDLDNYLKDWSL